MYKTYVSPSFARPRWFPLFHFCELKGKKGYLIILIYVFLILICISLFLITYLYFLFWKLLLPPVAYLFIALQLVSHICWRALSQRDESSPCVTCGRSSLRGRRLSSFLVYDVFVHAEMLNCRVVESVIFLFYGTLAFSFA